MAVSTSFSGTKLEALFFKSSSATLMSSLRNSNFSSFCQPIPSRRLIIQRGYRCEVAAFDAFSAQTDRSGSVSNVSALEQLKTSAADRYTKERSRIIAIGLSVHTATVEMREKLAIPEAEWPRAIAELCNLNQHFLVPATEWRYML